MPWLHVFMKKYLSINFSRNKNFDDLEDFNTIIRHPSYICYTEILHKIRKKCTQIWNHVQIICVIYDLKIQTSSILRLSFALFSSCFQLLPPNEICTHTKLFHQSFIKKHSLSLRTACRKNISKIY